MGRADKEQNIETRMPGKSKTKTAFSAKGVADSSSGGKFWTIEVNGSTMTTTWGALGSAPTTKDKEWNDEEKALKEAQKLVNTKRKGGYAIEVDGESGSDAKQAPPSKKKATPAKKAKAPPKAKAPVVAVGGGATFQARGVADSTSGGKFWQVEVNGSTMTVTYGKVGTSGQSKDKEWSDEETAIKEAQKLVKAKIKGGYVMEDEASGKAAKKSSGKKASDPY